MEKHFKDCYFRREGDVVVLGNSRIERAWTVGPNRLRTIRFLDKCTGRDWIGPLTPESTLTTQDGSHFLGMFPCESVEAEVVAPPISHPCFRIRFSLKGLSLEAWKCFDIFPALRASYRSG